MRDWQYNQHLNFKHHNHLFLKQTPRESREAFGIDQLPSSQEDVSPDAIVGWGSVIITICLVGFLISGSGL